ncbi:MAG: Uma2 family endonuclease [Planctomycetaceae bacterium]
MSSLTTSPRVRRGDRVSRRGQPAWEVAYLFPEQGTWTAEEYLALDCTGGRLIELVDGSLEVLPMPDLVHQRLVKYFHRQLDDFVTDGGLGEVYFAPLPLPLKAGRFREPDVIFVRPEQLVPQSGYPLGADLVMEVVSPGAANRKRDLETKRREYAAAGIAEYWIIDPEQKRVSVLRLRGKTYRTHGEFGLGDMATSALLTGFAIEVKRLFGFGKPVAGK